MAAEPGKPVIHPLTPPSGTAFIDTRTRGFMGDGFDGEEAGPTCLLAVEHQSADDRPTRLKSGSIMKVAEGTATPIGRKLAPSGLFATTAKVFSSTEVFAMSEKESITTLCSLCLTRARLAWPQRARKSPTGSIIKAGTRLRSGFVTV